MIRATLVLAFAALMLSGCGEVACGCAGIGIVPASPAPDPGFNRLITEKDREATAHVGQKIELVLHANNGMSNWSGVNVDDPAVLQAVPTGITAAKGVTIVGFEAVAPGTATIRATATPLCSPGQACPALAMLFQVVVTVTA